jgi:hypothetical protein
VGQDSGVAARSGDAQAEHVADSSEVAAGGMQFVQDPVLAGFLGGHLHGGGDPLDADRSAAQGGAPAYEDVGARTSLEVYGQTKAAGDAVVGGSRSRTTLPVA